MNKIIKILSIIALIEAIIFMSVILVLGVVVVNQIGSPPETPPPIVDVVPPTSYE